MVRDTQGNALGYAYFFGWKGQALDTSPTTSAAPDLSILVSGVSDARDPTSPPVQSEVDFVAGEMKPGLARMTQAGAIQFIVTLESVTTLSIDGTPYYDMGSLVVRIDVSI